MNKKMRTIAAFAFLMFSVFASMNLSNFTITKLKGWNNLVVNLLGVLLQIGILIGGLIICSKIEGKSLKNYGIRLNKQETLKLFFGLCLGIITFLLVCTPLYLSKAYILNSTTNSLEKILVNLFFFIGVGFVEEYVTRGFLQHHFLRFGPLPALLITAVLFGLLHLGNPEVTLFAILNIILAGCFMGSVMYAYNSIHAAVGVHITWNWIQGSVFGIPVSGTTQSGFFSTEIANKNDLITGGEFGVEASLVCTIVLSILTFVFLYLASKNGNLQKANKSKIS